MESAFRSMGVRSIFDFGEFGRISAEHPPAPLRVGAVKHRAVLEVGREGTRGAAATGFEVVLQSGLIDLVDLKVDRPFVFLVRDRREAVPLFVGRIMDPRVGAE